MSSMEYHVWRVEHELELSRTKGGAIQGLPQDFGSDLSPGFRPIAEKPAQLGALPDELRNYGVLSNNTQDFRLHQQNTTAAVPTVPSSSVAHVAEKMSARTFPCRGIMQVRDAPTPVLPQLVHRLFAVRQSSAGAHTRQH